LAFK
jgi:hypothetical protein